MAKTEGVSISATWLETYVISSNIPGDYSTDIDRYCLSENKWYTGPAAPAPLEGAVALKVSSHELLLAGGKVGSSTYQSKIYLLDTEGSNDWELIGNMNNARKYPRPGMIKLADGTRLVVFLGGHDGGWVRSHWSSHLLERAIPI